MSKDRLEYGDHDEQEEDDEDAVDPQYTGHGDATFDPAWFTRHEPRNERPGIEFDTLVDRLVTGFLLPACQYAPAAGKDFDHHAMWQPVRDAAMGIATYAWLNSADPIQLAQDATTACLTRVLSEGSKTPRIAAMIAGPNGLAKRVVAALVALGVGR